MGNIERASLYREELNQRIIPFWLNHAPDTLYGGHFSCLTTEGRVFDTDKFLWMQSRFLWMASRLARDDGSIVPPSLRSQSAAEAGRAVSFLLTHGRNENEDWYFALERDGKPKTAAYNIFTDVFALMGLSEYLKINDSLISSDLKSIAIKAAEKTWKRIWARADNPKGRYSKAVKDSRSYSPLNWPMIVLNMTMVIESSPLSMYIGVEDLQKLKTDAAADILRFHLDIDSRILRERISEQGIYLPENMEGRLLNPGHSCETLGFLIEALINDRSGLSEKIASIPEIKKKIENSKCNTPLELACKAVKWTLQTGWDDQFSGLFYYLDSEGLPPDKLEWDMKLWWVHAESALATLQAYIFSGDGELKEWYERLHDYMWKHFRKEGNSEWFGYLSRRGEPSHQLSGGKWKGFFHLPRALIKMIELLERDLNPDIRGTREY